METDRPALIRNGDLASGDWMPIPRQQRPIRDPRYAAVARGLALWLAMLAALAGLWYGALAGIGVL
jgi:hypothetical protein